MPESIFIYGARGIDAILYCLLTANLPALYLTLGKKEYELMTFLSEMKPEIKFWFITVQNWEKFNTSSLNNATGFCDLRKPFSHSLIEKAVQAKSRLILHTHSIHSSDLDFLAQFASNHIPLVPQNFSDVVAFFENDARVMLVDEAFLIQPGSPVDLLAKTNE